MAHDPKQTIIDFLSTPLAEPNSPFVVESAAKPRKGILRTSGGLGAIASTIHFLKERTLPRHQAHIVAFEDTMGQIWEFTCFIVQEKQDDWVFKGGGGGSAQRTDGHRQPRANLAGGWGAEGGFYAGGPVSDNGLNVVRVNLVTGNGLVFEDTVEDGRVLFVTDKNVLGPVRAQLYNSSGKLVSSHTTFNI